MSSFGRRGRSSIRFLTEVEDPFIEESFLEQDRLELYDWEKLTCPCCLEMYYQREERRLFDRHYGERANRSHDDLLQERYDEIFGWNPTCCEECWEHEGEEYDDWQRAFPGLAWEEA